MNRKPPQGYWNNKRNVIDDVKKYKKRSEWRNNSPGAYQSARRNNWLDECRKHIKSVFSVKQGFWQIRKNVIHDAKKYKTRTDWQKKSSGAYHSAHVNGWLEISCRHMELKRGKWFIKKNVINDSKKYKTRLEWAKNSGAAYQAALKNGWIDKCYAPR
jgi:hypothetical protein